MLLLLTGKIEQLYTAYLDFKPTKVTFSPSVSGLGYDLYATSSNLPIIYSINLSSGQSNTIKGEFEGNEIIQCTNFRMYPKHTSLVC